MATTRLESLEFVELALMRAVAHRELAAAPEVVFDVLADASGWVRWFPQMDQCRWLTPGPHGVDAQREVRVGPLHVVERFIVWDRPSRWGFTFTAASPPIARAGVELAELEPVGDGRTALTYTMALDPPVPAGGVAGVLARAMEAQLDAALVGLERYLATG